MSFPTPKLELIKNKYLLDWIESECEEDKTSESWDFYYSKDNNQKVYETFIKVKSPKEINISADMRAPLDKLATEKKWSNMNNGIKAARLEILKLLQKNTVQKFCNTGLGQRILAVVSLGLENPKAKLALGLIQLYTKPRREEDRYQAYLALQKLASKSKVDAALKGLNLPLVTKSSVVTDAEQVARNLKLHEAVKKLSERTTQNLKYYESALKHLKKEGRPADPLEVERMFESGRLRHDQIDEPYTQMIRRDKSFANKYTDFVKKKKLLDEAWAKMRQALG